MKQQKRVEFSDTIELNKLIKKTYFEENNGKIRGNENNLELFKTHPMYNEFVGLNKSCVKLENELIDGTIKCIVEEHKDIIKLFPISIYCIIDDEKYSFY
jgi:hypothetical protein